MRTSVNYIAWSHKHNVINGCISMYRWNEHCHTESESRPAHVMYTSIFMVTWGLYIASSSCAIPYVYTPNVIWEGIILHHICSLGVVIYVCCMAVSIHSLLVFWQVFIDIYTIMFKQYIVIECYSVYFVGLIQYEGNF